MTERIMIFIDGSNLYHSLKNHFNRADLDLGKFTGKLVQRRQLVRIYYYNALVGQKQEPEIYKQQQAFLAGVNAVPYTELRLGRLVYTNQWPSVPPYEKGTDVQLATDMITHSYKNNYDVAILVAGDNDFAGAVQAVKDNGKHVEVALFGNPGTSQQLREVSDRVVAVTAKVLKDCWSRQSPQPHQHLHHQPPQQLTPQQPAPQQPAPQPVPQPVQPQQPTQPQQTPSQPLQQTPPPVQQQPQPQQQPEPKPKRRRSNRNGRSRKSAQPPVTSTQEETAQVQNPQDS